MELIAIDFHGSRKNQFLFFLYEKMKLLRLNSDNLLNRVLDSAEFRNQPTRKRGIADLQSPGLWYLNMKVPTLHTEIGQDGFISKILRSLLRQTILPGPDLRV